MNKKKILDELMNMVLDKHKKTIFPPLKVINKNQFKTIERLSNPGAIYNFIITDE